MIKKHHHYNPFLVGYSQLRYQRYVRIIDDEGFPLADTYSLHPSQENLPDEVIYERACLHNYGSVYVLLNGQDVPESIKKKYGYQASIHEITYEITGRKGPAISFIGETHHLKSAKRLMNELPFNGYNYGRYWEISYGHLTDEDHEFMEAHSISPQGKQISEVQLVDIFRLPFMEGYGIRLESTPWTNRRVKRATGMDMAALRKSHEDIGMPVCLMNILHMAGVADARILFFNDIAYETPGLKIVKPDHEFRDMEYFMQFNLGK